MTVANKESRFFIAVKQFKAYIITEELIKNNWNVCKTATALGLHRNSLSRQIDLLGIENKHSRKHENKIKMENDSGGIDGGALLPEREAGGDGSLSVD